LTEISDFLSYDLTFFLLLACIALFGYLTFRSKNVRSFQFQISIFVLIWILGELANVLLYNGIISLPMSLQEIGYEIHLGSMIFFGIFLYARYYYSRKRGRELIENVEIEEYHPPATPNQLDQGANQDEGDDDMSPKENKS
jgi:membrane associated rhomboid family serine protease